MPRMLVKLIKKSRRQQYDVSSKDVFVITVELLDNAVLECTLSSESTGRSVEALSHLFYQMITKGKGSST